MGFRTFKSVFVGALLAIPLSSHSAEWPPIEVIKKNFATLDLADPSAWKSEEGGNVYTVDITRGFATYSSSGLHAILAVRYDNAQMDGLLGIAQCSKLLNSVLYDKLPDSYSEELIEITRDATKTEHEVSDMIYGVRFYTQYVPLGKNVTMVCGVRPI